MVRFMEKHLRLKSNRAKIARAYESGTPVNTLAISFDVSGGAIRKILREEGFKFQRDIRVKGSKRQRIGTNVLVRPQTRELAELFAESQGFNLTDSINVLVTSGFNALHPQNGNDSPQNGNATPCTTLHSTHFVLEGVHRETQFNPSNDSLRGKDGKILLRDEES